MSTKPTERDMSKSTENSHKREFSKECLDELMSVKSVHLSPSEYTSNIQNFPEPIVYGKCTECGMECNFHSQVCGRCARKMSGLF